MNQSESTINQSFSVRRAVATDAEQIANVTHEAFLKYVKSAALPTTDALSETLEQVQRDIETKNVYAAVLDGVIIGSVRIALDGTGGAYLSRFGVSDAYRSTGAGKALMDAVDADMARLGVKRLSLHTSSKVQSLIIFYYSKGFYVESTSTDKGYIRALLVKEYL